MLQDVGKPKTIVRIPHMPILNQLNRTGFLP